jgi:hypothetical protein
MSKLTILVLSCNKYSDLWFGFFKQYNEFFGIKREIYLATNNIDNHFLPEGIKIIEYGDEKNWSDTLSRVLHKIDNKKILVILEDIFITSKINVKLFSEIEKFVYEEDIQHFKYLAYPPGNNYDKNGYYKYEAGMPYSVSVCGIWDKNYLKNLILDGENPWQFEINGSYRASFSGYKFYSMKSALFTYHNMVEKGKFVKANYRWGLDNNLINQHERLVSTSNLYIFINIFHNIMIKINWKLRIKVINFIKKVIVVY